MGPLRKGSVGPAPGGFEAEREERFEDMLAFRDLDAAEDERRAPLHFLPTCIGCRKRWACAAAKTEVAR